MKTTSPKPDWRMYERFVVSLYSSQASDTITVTPNVELTGAISGVQRQIDLLIDARLEEDMNRRVIIDAKCRNRKINIMDVEAFESMMRDCRLVGEFWFVQLGLLKAQNKELKRILVCGWPPWRIWKRQI